MNLSRRGFLKLLASVPVVATIVVAQAKLEAIANALPEVDPPLTILGETWPTRFLFIVGNVTIFADDIDYHREQEWSKHYVMASPDPIYLPGRVRQRVAVHTRDPHARMFHDLFCSGVKQHCTVRVMTPELAPRQLFSEARFEGYFSTASTACDDRGISMRFDCENTQGIGGIAMSTKLITLADAGHGIGCLGKAADDEPVFVLRAQDALAPLIVRLWAEMAEFHIAPDVEVPKVMAKLDEARELANQMVEWQNAHSDTVKFPD